MTIQQFNPNEQVVITKPANHFKSCPETIYNVVRTDKVAGQYNVVLRSANGSIAGSIPVSCVVSYKRDIGKQKSKTV